MKLASRPLAAALCLLAAAAYSSCSGGGEKAKHKGPEIVVKDLRFRPVKMSVKVGGEVSWAFEDKGINHNVTADDGSFRSPNQSKGVFAHQFKTPGSVSYTCTIHPAQMKGTVEVRA